MGDTLGGTPLPCNSGILGIFEDPNTLIILYSNYYWVGGPPKGYSCSSGELYARRAEQGMEGGEFGEAFP